MRKHGTDTRDIKTISEAVNELKEIINNKSQDTAGRTILTGYFLGKANECLDIIDELANQ